MNTKQCARTVFVLVNLLGLALALPLLPAELASLKQSSAASDTYGKREPGGLFFI